MEKRAEMTTKELVELIIAAAVILVLVLVFFKVLSPYFDSGDETSKAYLDTLNREIEVANSDGLGEFFIWDIETTDSANYHLVYFGNRVTVSFGEITFTNNGDENNICICSVVSNKGFCEHCESLSKPVSFEGSSEEGFVVSAGQKISINELEDNYEFRDVSN